MAEAAGLSGVTSETGTANWWRSCLIVFLVLSLVLGVCAGLKLNQMNKLVRWSSGGNDLCAPMSACLNYTKDHGGEFPPLDPEPGRLMFERKIMHEKYGVTGRTLTMEFDTGAPFRWMDYEKEPALLDDTNLLNDHSWWYIGYVVRSEVEGTAFLRAYLEAVLQGTGFAENLSIPGTDRKVPRLHVFNEPRDDGSPDSDSANTPVFVERPGHYRGYSGGFVAYLDGHIEYQDYPGPFPMSTGFIGVLQAIDMVGTALTSH